MDNRSKIAKKVERAKRKEEKESKEERAKRREQRDNFAIKASAYACVMPSRSKVKPPKVG